MPDYLREKFTFRDLAHEGDRLSIERTELGGPAVEEASGKGFGTTLVEATISRHGGHLLRHWPAEGLVTSMNFPAASLAR
jgi:two-component sensor histidine kinase